MDGITGENEVQKRDEKESRPVEVTNDELRGFIDQAGVVDQTGAESLVVIMRHLLNERYRAGREDAARDIDEWASDYEAFAKGESNTELVVMNLRHAGRVARDGKGVEPLGHERDEEQHG